MRTRFGPHASARLVAEQLEDREVPAVTILVDYSLDLRANGGSGFFETHPEARATMNAVAQEMGARVDADLLAITPGTKNTWTASFYNPANGSQKSISNLRVAADTIIVYVAGQDMPGNAAGRGGAGGSGWSGSAAWGNTVAARGWSGFSLWGGSIGFDATQTWHFGLSASGLAANELDFYSVATHELGHVLGIGTAPQWFSQVRGSSFVGPNAAAVYGGPVPLNADHAHWADGITVGGRAVSLDPVMNYGTRVPWSSLDQAALRDVGWRPPSASPPPVSPPPVSPPPPAAGGGSPVLVAGASGGVVLVYARGADGNLAFTGRSFTPFPGFAGAIRTAVADFTGDGTADFAFATGAGTTARVRVINGATGADVAGATQVLGGFGGGVYVAAGDTNRDGKAELVVSADAGGLPAVEVYRVANGQLVGVTGFLAFSPNSRRGVRVAMGDLNGDGAAELIAAAGVGQLPRVSIYGGSALANGQVALLTGGFLAFGRGMTAGVNVTAGDVDGDGKADLIVSQDSGGTTLTRVWSGAAIAANPGTAVNGLPTYQQFYANGTTDRSGIRAVARDIDGNGKDEVVIAPAGGGQSWVRVLTVTSTSVDPLAPVFPSTTGGVTAGVSVAGPFEGFMPPSGPCLCCAPRADGVTCRRIS